MVWKLKITKEQQQKFRELYKNGESTVTIGKMFNITDVTVRRHLIFLDVKIRNKTEASKIAIINGRAKFPIPKQYKIPQSSKKLTKEKAYILGVLCGDGYISNYKGIGYQITLQSIDKEFINQFSEFIYKVYNLNAKESLIKSKNLNWNDKYQSRVCSKEVFEDLQRYNKSFKTFEWRIPKDILKSSNEIKAKFLQGFFDSEGYVNYKHKTLTASSANFEGIEEIKKLLDSLNIKSGIFNYKSRRIKVVFIRGKKSIELFNKLIGFIIIRKKGKP